MLFFSFSLNELSCFKTRVSGSEGGGAKKQVVSLYSPWEILKEEE